MSNIRRVLWVEDNERELNDSIKSLFVEAEKQSIDSIQGALNVISSEHLYDYDTIVLDIDFRDDRSSDFQEVIKALKEKIYLKKDQCNENFIKENGGYLIFLYLLECGYPSNQIAFLTGNQDIIDKLQRYTLMNRSDLSREEIVDLYEKIWRECSEDWEEFERQIYNLSGVESEYCIDSQFTESSFVDECVDALEDGNHEKLTALIKGIQIVSYDSQKDNSEEFENDMIFRFHRANLESPVYFSKHTDDIPQHNLSDARTWINERRTSDKRTRWLLLDAADYVEQLFRSNSSMGTQMGSLFSSINNDPGIRSSFRQMYFVFDGLRNDQRRGIYYQAISAMLIPFDSKPQSSGPSANVNNLGYDKVQKMFAQFSKQARNYCAHNYFGSTVSNETVIYLIMGTMSAVLTKNQQQIKNSWFENAEQIFNFDNINYILTDNIDKVDQLAQNLLNNENIDINSAHVEGQAYTDYTPWDMLRALGYNTTMNLAFEPSTTVREKYFIFTLAAYIIKWFEGLTEENVENRFGKGIRVAFEISNRIVANYNYPHTI